MKSKFKHWIEQINFRLFKLKNSIYVFFYKKNFTKRVAIVSSLRHKNKVKEDIYLKHSLNKLGVDATIIAWEDKTVNLKKYDALIVRSIWGFHHDLEAFYEWLERIEKSNIVLFNSVQIIRSSFDKEKQFALLDRYGVKHVNTIFLEHGNRINDEVLEICEGVYKKYSKLVIKPAISESGKDTYILRDNEKKNSISIAEIKDKFAHVHGKLMLQPFIENVCEGEISLISISGKLTHAVVRHCGIFTNKSMARNLDITKLDPELLTLAEQTMKIPEYKNHLYMRIDVVRVNDEYEIMEVELLDPNLFLTFIKDKRKREETLHYFAKSLKDRIDE